MGIENGISTVEQFNSEEVLDEKREGIFKRITPEQSKDIASWVSGVMMVGDMTLDTAKKIMKGTWNGVKGLGRLFRDHPIEAVGGTAAVITGAGITGQAVNSYLHRNDAKSGYQVEKLTEYEQSMVDKKDELKQGISDAVNTNNPDNQK